MIAFAISLLAVVGFGFGLWCLGIVSVMGKLAADMMKGVSAMLDSELDDASKEVAVRRSGLSVFAQSWRVAWRFAFALLMAALPILVADALGLAASGAVLSLMLRVDYIVGITLAAVIISQPLSRRKNGNWRRTDPSRAYGNADQFVHMLAFSGPRFHRATAALDDFVFRKRVKDFEIGPPVFVTSLARGGTTTVLNALSEVEGLAAHRYKDMPFISAPFLWNSMGRLIARRVERVERAHGDGLEIGLESPEAFDEVFWRLFWPEKYRNGKIDLWEIADARADAQEFFRRHFKKICYLRRTATGDRGQVTPRYLSKNNANIARLRLLPDYFPGCGIVVPVRRPAAHASSLLRQHRNFLRLQNEDAFVLRYMRDIGHLEFGLLHRTIAFPHLAVESYRADEPDYWLAYWIAAFREVVEQCDRCHIVVQDDLRGRPNHVIPALAERLDIRTGDTDFRRFFHARPDVDISDAFSDRLMKEARAIYDDLAERAVT